MPLWVILISLVFSLSVALLLKFRWKNRHILEAAKKLPCPKTLPLFGNTLLFIGGVSTVTKVVTDITSQFKGLFCLWIGPIPLFVVSKPEDVQIVLNSSNALDRDDVYQFLKIVVGKGIITSYGSMWKKYRRLLNPTLNANTVDNNYLTAFNDVSRQLTEKLLQSPKIDPTHEFFKLTVDAATNTVMDRDSTMDDKYKEMMYYIFDNLGRLFTNSIFKVWLHIDWVFKLLYWRELRVLLSKTEECRLMYANLTKESILRRLKSEGNYKYSGPENNLLYLSLVTPEEISENHTWWDEFACIFVGATETGASILPFFLFTIANHPAVQTKVRKEIQEVMGDSKRDVTVKDVDSFTYLNQVLMETMRFHGVFPVILRKTTKDTKLTTGVIPAGGRILLPLHAMGWNTDNFPEPHKFLPDRFSPEKISERHKYSFMPFSAGPRNCIGKRYAICLMKTVLVHILRRFEVRTQIRLEDIEYELRGVMYSKTPLLLEFVPLRSTDTTDYFKQNK